MGGDDHALCVWIPHTRILRYDIGSVFLAPLLAYVDVILCVQTKTVSIVRIPDSDVEIASVEVFGVKMVHRDHGYPELGRAWTSWGMPPPLDADGSKAWEELRAHPSAANNVVVSVGLFEKTTRRLRVVEETVGLREHALSLFREVGGNATPTIKIVSRNEPQIAQSLLDALVAAAGTSSGPPRLRMHYLRGEFDMLSADQYVKNNLDPLFGALRDHAALDVATVDTLVRWQVPAGVADEEEIARAHAQAVKVSVGHTGEAQDAGRSAEM